ncbi:Calx-beta domain-containing protein [Rhizobium sp. TRM95796]|uniref:Calx-beta domain-containing protein n=1 Tax=Rhizobium sp. TRM95796 TaxID=2979862 RepID=UPI0021E991C3|nr:Calx-beta domain-containing protein [Rhizobium sp. TRM95796]MCV3765658.1 hypothetical protein [Rhizobium sp. TRM95796]
MAIPEISVARVDATELSGEYVTFQISLSEASDEEVTMRFRSVEGTATGDDFSNGLESGTFTIAAGETTGLVSLRMYSDSTDEVDESIWLELFNAQNAVFSGGEATLRTLGVIRDNDGSGSNLSLFVSSPSFVEGNSGSTTAVFEVHLSQPYSSELSFSYTTVDGTAKAGSDYTATTGTVTFFAGQTVASVEIEVKGDTTIEASEFFSLVVTPTSDIASGTAGSTGMAAILDNDTGAAGAPEISVTRVDSTELSGEYVTFQISLSEASDEEVTMDFRSIEGTATAADFSNGMESGTVTIAAGETTGLVSFRLYGDSEDEVDESVWLELTNAQNAVFAGGDASLRAIGVVRDNDGSGSNLSLFVSSPTFVEGNSGSTAAVFEIHLSRPYASELSFSYTTVDGTATSGSDYTAETGTVTFLAGQTVASVEIDVKGDKTIEAGEFFSLVVTPTSEIKNDAAASTGMATILDNDTGGAGTPEISVSRVDATELSSEYVTFKVSLSEAADENVTMNFRGIEGTATAGDFSDSLQTATVTIEAGDTTGLVSFRMYGDSDDEVDESVWLELSNAKNAVFAGGETSLRALGVVRDNDGSGSNLALFVSSPTLKEGNNGVAKAVFEVHLSRPYDSDLSFSYKTANGTAKAGSDYVAETGKVEFLAGQTTATVEIDVKGDSAIEKNEYFSLVVTPTSEVKNGSPAHVGTATIRNDDTIHQTIYGTARNDKLYGYDGNDKLYGRAGNDLLDGGSGADRLYGEGGRDRLYGGVGGDKLNGGDGKDLFLFKSVKDSTTGASGRDSILDFSRKEGDRIDLSAIDANSKTGADDDFMFIGAKDFSKTAGELRFEKKSGDAFVYGDVNGDGRADFSLHIDGAASVDKAFFIL